MKRRILRRLLWLAYEEGWRNACDDHLTQRENPEHPIGARRCASVDAVLAVLDRYDLLGLRSIR